MGNRMWMKCGLASGLDFMAEAMAKARVKGSKLREKAVRKQVELTSQLRSRLACEQGQGTTEYAILVGVLVVIAILAITIFRPKLEQLWEAIASGINSL